MSILERMCNNCALVLDSEYIACTFKGMCITGFYSFMCVGEITATKQAPDVVQVSLLTKLSNTSGFIASVKLTSHYLEHHYNQPPMSITISCQLFVLGKASSLVRGPISTPKVWSLSSEQNSMSG